VVIPAFNEENRLGPTLARVIEHLEGGGRPYELLVVDDGSTDATVEVARRAGPQVEVVSLGRNRGKGAAVREGVMRSRGELVLMSDADLSTPIEELETLHRRVEQGADVVIASRSVLGSRLEERQPLYREMMGKVFNLLVQVMLLPGLWDTQCGFKLFRGEPGRRVFGRLVTEGYAFDVEALYLARCMGYTVVEQPVRWRNSPQTRVSALRDSTRMFIEIVRIRLRYRPGVTRDLRN
jgi:dolichyl-phosphate beta-glucosyltransferase